MSTCHLCLDIAHYLEDAPLSRTETVARGSVDNPAVILYTSGTTGTPKGIVNSQRAILQRVFQYVVSCHIGRQDRLLPLGGLVTIAGYREMFAGPLSGAMLGLVRLEEIGLRRLKDLVARRRPTIIYTVPSILRRIVAPAPSDDFSSLRVVRIGGEQVRWSDITAARRFLPKTCVLQIGYSSTESTGSQWFVPPDLQPDSGPRGASLARSG